LCGPVAPVLWFPGIDLIIGLSVSHFVTNIICSTTSTCRRQICFITLSFFISPLPAFFIFATTHHYFCVSPHLSRTAVPSKALEQDTQTTPFVIMSATRTSSRRQRMLPARYQDPEPLPSSSASTTTTTSASAATTSAPRGRKRSRSLSSSSRPSKRTSSQNTQKQLQSLEDDITLKLTASPAVNLPPRITVPLDIDITHVTLPSWIDMNTDYWTVWRHLYDKWRIQSKFAATKSVLTDQTEGYDLAIQEIDKLHYIREKLLMDHPDRQDIDLRMTKTVKLVWRYLSKAQRQGDQVAKFKCSRMETEMKWDILSDDENMWGQISAFLIEQGNEGRIFIDPRQYYDHYSWCVEDFGGEVTHELLTDFYCKFARMVNPEEGVIKEIHDCKDCTASTECCTCEDTCLLCLPQADGYSPVSPLSSLPSPPRTPGTQPLPSYFKGKRLSHPPPESHDKFTNDEAVDILLAFSGHERPSISRHKKQRGRSKTSSATHSQNFDFLEIQ
jgi:hypothetical protein